jgi:type IV fimbrial biogenesis protein FimT
MEVTLHRPQRRSRGDQGFTLIEAMVTLAVLVILMAVAAPSFRAYTEGQRIKTATQELVFGLSYARSEAIARRADVSLVAATGGFVNGWTIETGATVLREQAALTGIAVNGVSATTLTYGLDGRTGGSFNALIEAPSGGSSTEKRCISLDAMGMPRSRKTTSSSC